MIDAATNTIDSVEPMMMESDLARSAWYDPIFASWFATHAKRSVLFTGSRGEDYFRECGEFARQHKVAPAATNDAPQILLHSRGALDFFKTLKFDTLPGGRNCKPTTWQMEKARTYLRGRYNKILSERLEDAEQVRANGEQSRADVLAAEARREFASFNDSIVPCTRLMDDIDEILSLAESNPPLFTIDGEIGRQLNSRLKPDNLGILLGDQKIGKTTNLLDLATLAALRVPTLFVSTGDETKKKLNARASTFLSGRVTQREYVGRYGMPIPDCEHNACGTCPINMSGEPRQVKDWQTLIKNGGRPLDLAEGTFDGSATVSGKQYRPCCRCFPRNDGTPEDEQRKRNWRSAIWWRAEKFDLVDRKTLEATKTNFELTAGNGGMRLASYEAGKFSVEMLEELLNTLDRTENFVPMVVVVDYADLMKQLEGRASDKDHDGMRRIWEGLRALSSKYNLLIITATQTNRSGGIKQKTHTRKTIGRSAKAADNCTWLVSLNQTVQERRAKVARWSMMYAREGAFDPEYQALACLWHEAQDAFAFSMPVFCKIEDDEEDEGK